jgi:hypothetical protein
MSELLHPRLPEAVPLYYAILSCFRGLVWHLIATHSTGYRYSIAGGNVVLTQNSRMLP